MKARSTLLMVAVLWSINTIISQDVSNSQKPLFTKITATWCPNCGTWGWSHMKSVVADNEEDALILGAHHSGDLQSAAGSFLAQNFNTSGQPRFILNNTDQNVNSGNSSSKVTEIRNAVLNTINADAKVNTGVNLSLSGDELKIDTRTLFFEEMTGAYYLSIYLVENKVTANQSGQGSSAEHPYVLRDVATAVEGDLVIDGTAGANQAYTGTYTMMLSDEYNIEELSVYALIWKKENDTYLYQNGDRFEVNQASTSDTRHELRGIEVHPTVSHGYFSIRGDQALISKSQMTIYNMIGQQVIPPQRAPEVIDLHDFVQGIYLIRIDVDDMSRTVKVMKR